MIILNSRENTKPKQIIMKESEEEEPEPIIIRTKAKPKQKVVINDPK